MSSVDVCVPCYNYGRFLPGAVNSVLTQQGVAVRVLILDDCSSDDSEAVGRTLAAADPRVEYRRHVVNRGHLTFDEGIDWLAGDYCLLLSADDMLIPGALARAAAVMDAHPGVGLTYGYAINTGHPDPTRDRQRVPPEVVLHEGLEFIRSACETAVNIVPTPTAIARTATQKVIGKFHPGLPHAGDFEMWLRFAAHADVAFIRSHQAYYRLHPASMSLAFRGSRDLGQVMKAFEVFFDRWGHRLPDAGEFRRLVAERVLREAFDGAYQAVERGDDLEYRAYSRLAGGVAPGVRTGGEWLRLRARRAAGPRVGKWLQSFRRRLSAVTAQPPAVPMPEPGCGH